MRSVAVDDKPQVSLTKLFIACSNNIISSTTVFIAMTSQRNIYVV